MGVAGNCTNTLAMELAAVCHKPIWHQSYPGYRVIPRSLKVSLELARSFSLKPAQQFSGLKNRNDIGQIALGNSKLQGGNKIANLSYDWSCTSEATLKNMG